MKTLLLPLLTSLFLGGAALAQVTLPSGHPQVSFRASATSVSPGRSIEFMLDTPMGGALAPQALTGSYSFLPLGNTWHSVTITHEGGSQYRWTNQAGVSWRLTLDPTGTYFDTGTDNPYYYSLPQYRKVGILAGDGKAAGLEFLGSRYMRPLEERLVGTYQRNPLEYIWHTGHLEIVPGSLTQMRWRNDAGQVFGVSIQSRSYENGLEKASTVVLDTGEQFRLVWEGHNVTGFWRARLFSRNFQSMARGPRLGVDADGLIESLTHFASGRTFFFPVSTNPAGALFGASVRRSFQPVDATGQVLPPGQYWVEFVYYVDLGAGPFAVQTGTTLIIGSAFAPGRISRSFYRSLGADPLSGSFNLFAEASKWTSGATNGVSAKANTIANVNLFGVNREVFRFEADGTLRLDNSAAPATSRILARVGGYDVANVNTNQLSISQGIQVRATVLNASQTYWLAGFIPITVHASAGLQSAGTVSLNANVGDAKVTMTATPSASLFGSASAGVGIVVASAGVYADLDLFNSSFEFPISVDANTGLGASMRYVFQPIAVSLGIYAELDFFFWSDYYSWAIYSWSSPYLDQRLSLL